MTTWSFRDALEELKVKGCFSESVLKSTIGLHLGDVCFTELQTTIKMCVVHFHTFLQYVKQGSFNAGNLPLDGYSHTTAILLAFLPDQHLEDIERIGIGSVIWRHRSPLGDISSLNMVIKFICSILTTEQHKSPLKCRASMMLIGNYGGHMAFDTNPPYCVVYAADYKNTNDPSKMTPHEPLNHMYAMVSSNMVVRRLLSLPNWEPAERKLTTSGRLLILRVCSLIPVCFLNSHTMQPHGSTGWFSHAAGGPISDYWTLPSHGFDFSQPSRGSGVVYGQEVAKLKELGVLNPPNAPGHLPLFLPLVSSSRGKVVSAALWHATSQFWFTWYRAVFGDWSRRGICPLWQLIRPSLQHHGQQHHVGQA